MADSDNILSKATGVVKNVENTIKEAKNEIAKNITGVTGVITNLAQSLYGVISPFAKVQSAAADLAKSFGLAGKSIMSNSMLLVEQNKKMQLSRSYGISNEEMMKLQMSVIGGLGRNVRIDQVGTATPENPNFDSAMENLVAANQVFGTENVAKIVAGYDKLGISMKTAAKATGKLYKEAGEYGINLQKYTQNFTENLHMAQMYNFRNGVNGLKEMARKATEIRQSMKDVAAFADKVNNVEGAVQTAAQLQVLGGSFSAMANPLTMLNKSLTDLNGLAGMAESMTEGAATYNSVTHEIEMDPVTRQIMKRAAESMGMDPGALIDQAYAQARRAEVTKQMDGFGNLSDDIRKMLPNVAEIDSETGLAGATIGGEFKSLAEIAADPELQKQLVEETRSESDDIKVIAKSVMSIEDIVAGLTGQAENELARNAIMPGVVSGKSSLDLAMDALTKMINEDTIAGAGKIDQTFSSLLQNWNVLTGSAINEAIKPFSSSNPEEFGTKMGEAFNNVFGDIFGEGVASEFGKNIGSELAGVAESIGKKLEEYGLTSMKVFNSTEHEGREGRTPLAQEAAEQARNSVALAARDVSIEATNFSLNGGENSQIQPIVGNGISRAASAIQGDNSHIDTIIQTLASAFGYTVTAPLTATDNGQTTGKFSVSETSIPSTTVAPGENKGQTTSQQGTIERSNENNGQTIHITVSGTITVANNNQNIEFSEDEVKKIIMKSLENSPQFKQGMGKILGDSYVETDKRFGLASN